MRPWNTGNYGEKVTVSILLPYRIDPHSAWSIALSQCGDPHIAVGGNSLVDIVHIVTSPHYNLGQVMADDRYLFVTSLALSDIISVMFMIVYRDVCI